MVRIRFSKPKLRRAILLGCWTAMWLLLLFRWGQSHQTWHWIWPTWLGEKYTVLSINQSGWETVQITTNWPASVPPQYRTCVLSGCQPNEPHFYLPGFSYWRAQYFGSGWDSVAKTALPGGILTFYNVSVMHVWLAVILLCPLIVIVARRLLRARRRRGRILTGHCPVCNYDLRASPARCPECGTPAATIKR